MARPVGSTTKPQLRDYMTEEQAKLLVCVAITKANDGNDKLLQFLLEQYYGRAAQNLNLANADGTPFILNLVTYGNNPTLPVSAEAIPAPTPESTG